MDGRLSAAVRPIEYENDPNAGRLWVSSGSQGGPPKWPSPPLLPAPLARGGDAVYQQLTGSRNVFTAVVVVPAVDVPPVEIRTIAFVTGVGQSDPVEMPGVAPRGDRNDDFHS
jgi:hypothetical protein